MKFEDPEDPAFKYRGEWLFGMNPKNPRVREKLNYEDKLIKLAERQVKENKEKLKRGHLTEEERDRLIGISKYLEKELTRYKENMQYLKQHMQYAKQYIKHKCPKQDPDFEDPKEELSGKNSKDYKKMEDKESKEDKKTEKTEKLEDLKCKNCRYWHLHPNEREVGEEVLKCRIRYYDAVKMPTNPLNQRIYRRRWITVGPLEVCEYYIDKRKRKRPEEALYESIQIKKKALEKMADDIVELQSKKSPKTKAMIEDYNKRLKVFKEHIADYNKIIYKGAFPNAQGKKK